MCNETLWLFLSNQVAMELTRDEFGNIPKRYALDMSKDFIPMFVFSESSSHGKET